MPITDGIRGRSHRARGPETGLERRVQALGFVGRFFVTVNRTGFDAAILCERISAGCFWLTADNGTYDSPRRCSAQDISPVPNASAGLAEGGSAQSSRVLFPYSQALSCNACAPRYPSAHTKITDRFFLLAQRSDRNSPMHPTNSVQMMCSPPLASLRVIAIKSVVIIKIACCTNGK